MQIDRNSSITLNTHTTRATAIEAGDLIVFEGGNDSRNLLLVDAIREEDFDRGRVKFDATVLKGGHTILLDADLMDTFEVVVGEF